MPQGAKAYLWVVVLAGAACLAAGILTWSSPQPLHLVFYVPVIVLASALKAPLPGVAGTISLSFVIILCGVIDLAHAEVAVAAALAALIQSWWHSRYKPVAAQLVFNSAEQAISATVAYWGPRWILAAVQFESVLLWLPLAACLLLVTNVTITTLMIALVEQQRWRMLWSKCCFWALPYYLAGASLVGLIRVLVHPGRWHAVVLAVTTLLFAAWAARRFLKMMARPKIRQRKKRFRIDANIKLRWVEPDGVKVEAVAHMRDVSETGAALECDRPVNARTVQIAAPEYDLRGQAQVVHSRFVEGKYRVGIEFHYGLSREQIQQLVLARAHAVR